MYVDKNYYDNEYKGVAVEATDFDQLEMRSSEVINNLTGYKVAQQGIDSLHPFFQIQVKKAVCAQIEQFVINGGYESTKERNALGNVSIGSFSYGSSEGKSIEVSSNVYDFLKPTGLLYSGIGVCHG
jgi:hypothetical protein